MLHDSPRQNLVPLAVAETEKRQRELEQKPAESGRGSEKNGSSPPPPAALSQTTQQKLGRERDSESETAAELLMFKPYHNGFQEGWPSAVGKIKPSPEVVKIIEESKGGLFAEADEAEAWQESILGFLELKTLWTGLMGNTTIYTGALNARGQATIGNQTRTFVRQQALLFGPGIGEPARRLSNTQLAEVNLLLAELGGLSGEKILAYIPDLEGRFELWTTECIYAKGYGGGLSYFNARNGESGSRDGKMSFSDEGSRIKVLRFWDLALSNDTMVEIDSFGINRKIRLERTIEPKTTTTVFLEENYVADLLFLQNLCRQTLKKRIVNALQKDRQMVENHSGFRCVKWGSSFVETSLLLMPFLQHDPTLERNKRAGPNEFFITSRLTPDAALLYEKHPVYPDAVASTIRSGLWPDVLRLSSSSITQNVAEQKGIEIATRAFAGQPEGLRKFITTTGIPVAPDFDYWSYSASAGRYTAWFIDDQFYAMEIEPNAEYDQDRDTSSHANRVMENLTNRYGVFRNQKVRDGESHFIHEDEEGGTLVIYEPKAYKPNPKRIERIYHYSLKMRSMVYAKMEAMKDEDERKAAAEKAAKARKASQF